MTQLDVYIISNTSTMTCININKLCKLAIYRNHFFMKRETTASDREHENKASFTLIVDNKCLKSWYDLKKQVPDIISYVKIINCFLADGYAVLLKENCARVENHIRKMAVISKTKLSTKRGRAYTVFANGSKRICIRGDEVQYLSEVKQELSNCISENEHLRIETNSVAKRCDELADNLANVTEEKNGAE